MNRVQKYSIAASIMMFMIITFACQEVYYPEIEETDNNIISIEGYLSNSPDDNEIKLCLPAGYYQSNMEIIPDADVFIMNNKNVIQSYVHSGNGIYKPADPGFKGIPGFFYQLNIILPNGLEYQSNMIQMPVPKQRLNISAEIGQLKLITKDNNNEIFIRNFEGLEVYYDILSDNKTKQYYRIEKTVVEQYTYYYYKNKLFTEKRYLWKVTKPKDVTDIAVSNLYNSHQSVLNKKYFLQYKTDYTIESDTATPAFLYGWVMVQYVHSISREAYEYYQAMNEQLDAENRIFEPIPTNLPGNIRNIEDPTAKTVGIFDISAVDTFYTAFYWIPLSSEIYSLQMDTYKLPDQPIGIKKTRPSFWVDKEMMHLQELK